MRVLLDECLPSDLAAELKGHVVVTVPQVRWAGLKNGELLSRAAGATAGACDPQILAIAPAL